MINAVALCWHRPIETLEARTPAQPESPHRSVGSAIKGAGRQRQRQSVYSEITR